MAHIQVCITTQETPQLYQFKADPDDPGWDYKLRPCAFGTDPGTNGCPGVAVIYDQTTMKLDRDWQFYLIAINPGMERKHISALLDYKRAFANGTGFGKPGTPRANYIMGTNLNAPLPGFDKDRDCILNLCAGVPVGSDLLLDTFDGDQPPPMKPGRPRPQTLAEIRPDDYLCLPETHRWKFVVANVIKAQPGGNYTVFPFGNGAIYAWTGDNEPYSFVPLVSRHQVLYPLNRLWMLSKGSPYPSPYKRT